MTSPWPRPRILLLAFALTLVAAPVPAREPTVTLRAVNRNVSGDVVRYVATNSEATRLDPGNFDADSRQTPTQIIERRCGSLRSEYYEAFLRINSLADLPPDQPIGDAARTLLWPSCLYVRPAAGDVTAVVKKDDSAARLYTRLTGGHATQKELEKFFGKSLRDLKHLQPGEVLEGGHVTAAVSVTPTGNVAEFESGLAALVEADAATKLRTVAAPTGEIVLPIEDAPEGEVASGTNDCTPSGEPFDADSVRMAFRHARMRMEQLELYRGQSRIFIVDNGFQGANANLGTQAFDGSPFQRAFFLGSNEGVIGQKLVIGSTYWPLNTLADTGDASVKGHGTHVAGLALGGPAFDADRRALTYDQIWGRLVILNLSRGERVLADGAVQALQGILGVPEEGRIVNMSIAFDGTVSPDVATVFDGMITNATQTLFVVAAGNRSRDVTGEIYPAALGGIRSDNVMTIAASDGNGNLAPFSNYGESTVDLVAPGCQLKSWVDNTGTQVPLSGTSQATPVVTFAASLLYSLAPRLGPKGLKTRLIASGDLVPAQDLGKTAYDAELDIPKALYLFDDYLAVRDGSNTYLGSATNISGIRCKGTPASSPRKLESIWSIKRRDNRTWIYGGRSTGEQGDPEKPCEAVVSDTARMMFVPAYKVIGSAIEPLASDEIEVPFADVVEYIAKARIRN